MSKRVFARATALLGAATLAAGVMVAIAAPAQAASLGTLTLKGTDGNPQTSGNVNDTPMFATATTSAPCPAGYGENASLRVGRPGGPYNNLAKTLGGGGYDEAPVVSDSNRSFTTALGAAPAAGDWVIIMECYSLTEGRHADEFQLPIRVVGDTWEVPPPAQATTTTLSVSPASPVDQGAEVSFTASVAPNTAPGTVEFRRGDVSLGTATVNGGTATFSTTALPVGTYQYTAVFSSTSVDFLGSTSAPVSFRVNGSGGGGTQPVEIVAPVEPGKFTINVAANSATLTGGSVGGSATGALPQATVTDLRGNSTGWTVTGDVEPFTSGSDTIASNHLSWTPAAAKVSGSGAVTAGAASDLGDPKTLCSTVSGTNAGTFTCDAGLTLSIPDNVGPGEYAATLTLTLA